MKNRILCVCVALVVSCCVSAVADDFAPPDYRGLPLSYYAHWDTFTNGSWATGIYTDNENAVDDDDPNTTLYNGFATHLDPDGGGGWLVDNGGIVNPERTATFAANVINWIDLEPEKLIRVQFTWTDGGNGAPYISGMNAYDTETTTCTLIDSVIVESGVQGLNYLYEDWMIIPNPDWEQIIVTVPMATRI